MGRKSRYRGKLQRRKASREPRDRILIVCEGAKTEPYYFKHFIKKLRLSSAKVKVIGQECGSAPISVVDYAIDEIRQEKNNPYDQVWCVFDVEIKGNQSLNEAYDKIVTYTPPKYSPTKLKHALTNPFFEYWYILHFKKTSRLFNNKRKLLDYLKQYIHDYNKGNSSIPSLLYPDTNNAINNAELVINEKHYGDDLRSCNPSTHIHLLVKYLQEVAKR